jgi:hypothetical protein
MGYLPTMGKPSSGNMEGGWVMDRGEMAKN